MVLISSDFGKKSSCERIEILARATYEIFAPVEALAETLKERESGWFSVLKFAFNGEVLCEV